MQTIPRERCAHRLPKRFAWLAMVAAWGWAPGFSQFQPGNLVVSRSVYQGTGSTVTVGEALPPNCPAGNASCTTAQYNGSFPDVFYNATNPSGATGDSSFGVTS